MRHELWYTSAPRGLDTGSSGYCTVKLTRGMPPSLRELLERMSQYRHIQLPGHSRANENPVIVSCATATVSDNTWHILSRICDASADHTDRTNFFAHHIAYDSAEGPRDPAWLAREPDTFAKEWDSRTEELASARDLPTGEESLQPCAAWRAICGDAGWAGAVADAILEHDAVYLVSDGTRPLIPLIAEVATLLPKANRSELTFSTLYHGTSSDLNCQLRCVVAGSDEAKRAVASRARLFDLALAPHGKPPETPRVVAARTGAFPEPPAPVPKTVETGVPGSFTTKQSAPPNSAVRDAANTINRPLPKKLPAATAAPTSASQSDALLIWLPVLSGIGGLVLGALVLIPFLISYRNDSLRQKELVAQRTRDVTTISRELSTQMTAKATIERDRDDLRKKREQAESGARTAKEKSDREIKDSQDEIAQLKKQREDDDTQHKNDVDKIASLHKQLDEAIAAQKAAEAQANATPKPAPPPPVRMLSRLPDPNANVRFIDYIPAEPTAIEIQGAAGFHVVPRSADVWDVQQNDVTVAKLGIDKTRQPLSIRFNWVAGNKTDDFQTIHEKLKRATLHVTIRDNEIIVLPLFYTLAPSKDETAPQQP